MNGGHEIISWRPFHMLGEFVFDITEGDRNKLRMLCELQEKYLEKIPKTIRDTDFSTSVGVALQCNMDILREVACRLGHGFYPHAPYIMEKHECVKNYLERAGIIREKEGKGSLGIFPKGPIMTWLKDREICMDILRKLRETKQVYIVDHDVPISVSKHLFALLDWKRREEARKRGIPEVQFEWEDLLAMLVGLVKS